MTQRINLITCYKIIRLPERNKPFGSNRNALPFIYRLRIAAKTTQTVIDSTSRDIIDITIYQIIL